MKNSIIAVGILLAMAAALLAGCREAPQISDSPANEAGVHGDGSVIVGISTDLLTLDPAYMYEIFGNMVAGAVYDSLFRMEGDSVTPVPSLAEDWSLDDSGRVYTFTLRRDVTFHSGNPLTAADVVYSFHRVRNLAGNAYGHLEGIADVRAEDDYTVVYTLEEPNAAFLSRLTNSAFSVLDSRTVMEHGGTGEPGDTAKEYLDTHSAGSGPYILVSWTPGEELILEKNPDYWREVGNVERFILREIHDPDLQLELLRQGEIDIAYDMTMSVDQRSDLADIQVVRSATSTQTFLLMHQDPEIGGPVSDPLVQQAIRRAIDYDRIYQQVGKGGRLPLGCVPMGFLGALERDYNYTDRQMARRLLEEAGYSNGFAITLTCADYYTEGVSWETLGDMIREDLSKVGIWVTLETPEFSRVLEEYREGNCGFLLMNWSPDYPDINSQLAFLPGNTVGLRAGWQEEEGGRILAVGEKILRSSSETIRSAYAEELQTMMDEDSPYAFLLQHPKYYAYRDWLGEVHYNDKLRLQLSEIVIL